MRQTQWPAISHVRKYQRLGLPIPPKVEAAAKDERRQRYRYAKRPRRVGVAKRAAYWREYKRRVKLGITGAAGGTHG